MPKKLSKFIYIYYPEFPGLPGWRNTIETIIIAETGLNKNNIKINPAVKNPNNKLVIELTKGISLEEGELESQIIEALRESEFESVLDKKRYALAEEHIFRMERWENDEARRRKEWEKSFSKTYIDGLEEFRRDVDKRRQWESAEMVRRTEFESNIVKENQARNKWEKIQNAKFNIAISTSILSVIFSLTSLYFHFF